MSSPAEHEMPRRALRATLILLARWLVMVSGALVFVAIALSFRGALVSSVDVSVSRWVVEAQPPWLTRVAFLLTQLGNGPVLAVIAAGVSVALFFARHRALSLYVAVSALGAGGLNTVLKLLFARERPDQLWHLASTSGYSFPSGHAMASAAIYGAIALVLGFRYEKHGRIAAALWVLLVACIGTSRVVLGVHYTTDVLAGWALGISWPLWLRPLLVTPAKAQPAAEGASDRPLVVDHRDQA
jgi:undecaprenyl-diphosphatase